jgi:hypothetical protein
MANFKRKSTKRRVKCTRCTQHRWMGNNSGRFKIKDKTKDNDYLSNM